MRITLTASLVLLLGLVASASAQVNPIYARLKAYRTYFDVTATTPMAQRFKVWFIDKDYCFCSIAGNTVQEMENLTEHDLHLWWGGFSLPPSSVEPVPAPLKPLADAMLARVKVLHPDGKNFLVSYAGEFRTVSIREMTPLAREGDPGKRLSHNGNANFAIKRDGTVAGTEGMTGIGTGLVAHPAFPDESTKLPHFVDFRLPPELESYSLVAGYLYHLGGASAAAWNQMIAAALKTAKAIEEGTYKNPIEELLAQQGSTVLPEGFDAQLTVEVDSYARHADFQHQQHASARLLFSTRAVLAGPVTQTFRAEKLGLTYRVTLDLKRLIVSFNIKNSAGDEKSAAYELKYSNGVEPIVEGNSTALNGGYVLAQMDENTREITVPGTDGFQQFDNYPETSIHVPYVLGKVPAKLAAAESNRRARTALAR
jgi:hypothetical protein